MRQSNWKLYVFVFSCNVKRSQKGKLLINFEMGIPLVLLFSLVINDCWPYGLIELVYRSEYMCGIWNWPPEFISSNHDWLSFDLPLLRSIPCFQTKSASFIRFYQLLSCFIMFYQVFWVAMAGSSITDQHPSIIWIHCFVTQISSNIECSLVFWVFSDVT